MRLEFPARWEITLVPPPLPPRGSCCERGARSMNVSTRLLHAGATRRVAAPAIGSKFNLEPDGFVEMFVARKGLTRREARLADVTVNNSARGNVRPRSLRCYRAEEQTTDHPEMGHQSTTRRSMGCSRGTERNEDDARWMSAGPDNR